MEREKKRKHSVVYCLHKADLEKHLCHGTLLSQCVEWKEKKLVYYLHKTELENIFVMVHCSHNV